MAGPKRIEEIEPIPHHDPTKLSEIVDSVEAADAAAETTPLKEKNGFMRAVPVERVVKDVVYKKLGHLQGEKIICLFTVKASAANSPYKLKKIGAMHSAIAVYSSLVDSDVVDSGDEFFVLIVPHAIWQGIDARTQEALVYDALQHIELDAKSGNRYIKKPDFQGFFNTVAEYGLWQESLKQFGDVAKPHIAQLQLIES